MESKNDDNNRLTFELGLNSGTLTSRSTSIIRVSPKSCGKEKQNTEESESVNVLSTGCCEDLFM